MASINFLVTQEEFRKIEHERKSITQEKTKMGE